MVASPARQRVGEIDYLLGVRDDLRQGALRFRDPDSGAYLADDATGVPSLLEMPRLMAAAERLEREEATAEDLDTLQRGGSSLGGGRPKAHVLDADGRIAIAKLPSPTTDAWDVIRWEAVAHSLARHSGMTVPDSSASATTGSCARAALAGRSRLRSTSTQTRSRDPSS